MNNPLSRRDIESLSAYLDDRLSPRQRRALRARISSDPALRTALHSMAQTRALLHRAPQAKRPRSFTLTAEMLGERTKPARTYPAMRLVSAIASMLFVVVVFGDIFLGGAIGGAETANKSMMAAGVADEAEMAPMAMEAGDMEAPEAAEAPLAEADEETVAADAPAEQVDGLGQQTSETPEFMPTPSVSGTLAVDGTQLPVVPSSTAAAEEPGGIATFSRSLPDDEAAESDNSGLTVAAEDDFGPRTAKVWLRIGETLLAVIAIGSGAAAYILRRR